MAFTKTPQRLRVNASIRDYISIPAWPPPRKSVLGGDCFRPPPHCFIGASSSGTPVAEDITGQWPSYFHLHPSIYLLLISSPYMLTLDSCLAVLRFGFQISALILRVKEYCIHVETPGKFTDLKIRGTGGHFGWPESERGCPWPLLATP